MENDYYKQYEPFFGSWCIKRFIGAGSYGKVFEIERRDEFDTVYTGALKAITIPSSQSELDEILADGMDREGASTYFRDYVRDLNREIALMSKLKGHSNIVSYEDHALFSHKDGLGWDILIRMELLTPITNYLRQNHSFTRREVIHLGIDLCRALEICQKYNIIHRDIKPANIFISDTDDFKLGDFGVARIASASTGASTRAGTINYMAPEVFRGEKYTSNVDIYSLGLVMYQLLNNNRMPLYPAYPQPITPSSREQAQARRLSGVALPSPANADGRLAEIILKACTPDPSDRYESPAVMRQALEAILYTEKEARMIYPEGDTVPVPDTSNSQKSQDKPAGDTGNATVGFFGAPVRRTVPAPAPAQNAPAEQAPAQDTLTERVPVQTVSAPEQDAPTERVMVQDPVPADDKTQFLFKSQEEERRRQEEAACAAEEERRRKEQEAKEAELARIREEKRKAEAERKATEEGTQKEEDPVEEKKEPIAPHDRRKFIKCPASVVETVASESLDKWGALLHKLNKTKIISPSVSANSLKSAVSSKISSDVSSSTKIEVIGSGRCGENVTWKLYFDRTLFDRTLYISGFGCMVDYDSTNGVPWKDEGKRIRKVVVEEGITRIGSWAFASGYNLTSAELPSSVTSIGNSAFHGCSLTSINIPDGVTNIESNAFMYCFELTSVELPSSVTSIGKSAFYGCGLISIDIPDGVTSIADFAFSACRSLTTINIPDGVTSISSFAFSDCRSLTSISIPSSVTNIGWSAFDGCENLKSVTISRKCTVDEKAFPSSVQINYYN